MIMKLENLVNYFRNGGSFEKFCQMESLELESEVIEIYMEKPFTLCKELRFFEIEKTEGNIEFMFSNVKYFNLFDFYYFLDVISESNIKNNTLMTDNDVAKKILAYAIHDA